MYGCETASSSGKSIFSPTRPNHGPDQITRLDQLRPGVRVIEVSASSKVRHVVAGSPFKGETGDLALPVLTRYYWGWYLGIQYLTDKAICPYPTSGLWNPTNWLSRDHHAPMSPKTLVRILSQIAKKSNNGKIREQAERCLAELQ